MATQLTVGIILLGVLWMTDMMAVSLLGRDDGRGSSKASSDESSELHDDE